MYRMYTCTDLQNTYMHLITNTYRHVYVYIHTHRHICIGMDMYICASIYVDMCPCMTRAALDVFQEVEGPLPAGRRGAASLGGCWPTGTGPLLG